MLVRGLAIDYYPDRQPASSPIYRIHVLSREAHARLIHDQFEKLMEQLEELTRRQEAILQSGKAVRAQEAAADWRAMNRRKSWGSNPPSSEQTGGAAQESRKARSARSLAEALRNPQISPDTLKDWAAHAEQMDRLAGHGDAGGGQSLDAAEAGRIASGRGSWIRRCARNSKSSMRCARCRRRRTTDLETLMAQTLAARLRRAAAPSRTSRPISRKCCRKPSG